ncbi:Phage late control protein GPD [compost metagenome]
MIHIAHRKRIGQNRGQPLLHAVLIRLSDRSTHQGVSTQYQDPASGELLISHLDNPNVPEGLPPVHTDRHLYPDRTAADEAAKARLAAFNRSTASVRLDLPGRTDLFAESMIEALGFKRGLDGEYLVESVDHTFTPSGWTVSVECNGGKEGKAKASGKPQKVVLEVAD